MCILGSLKARSGLPITVNWSFFTRCYGCVATSEEIESWLFRSNAVNLIQNYRWKWSPQPIILAQLVESINALQLCGWKFSHKETSQQTLFTRGALLHRNRLCSIFETLFGYLGAMYDNHLRLIGKRVVDFPLMLIELFRWVLRLRCYK